jgi:NAD(P)-dependent dehydrogenase (short-subunit alcohol dehydrogenase family)
MDPAEFGISTRPLHHSPYPAISAETLGGANAGKVAVVTGAAQGIGAAIASALAKSGASIALLDLDVPRLDATVQACQALNVPVRAYACDVADEEAVKATFDSVERDLGLIE